MSGWLVVSGLLIWASILVLPWRPWSTRESLDADLSKKLNTDSVTVLIPARNEAEVIGMTLKALADQGQDIKVVIVDDQSTDDTAELIRQSGIHDLISLEGKPLEDGWSGKLWALEQGRQRVETENILLMDADIALKPGMLATLLDKMQAEDLHMVSLMANLKMETFREKLLMPAFVFFFKLLYPFRLANSHFKYVAAAAGGCILIKKHVLDELGGFAILKHALIDDCTLARKIKDRGHRTWLGLSHDAVSLRDYRQPGTIWEMVARTAFTQLKYSFLLLLLCTVLMICAFIVPVAYLFTPETVIRITALLTLILMLLSYLPTLFYYKIHPVWALGLPVTGVIYLLMTWSSAIEHWRGSGALWKDRYYSR